MIPSHWEEMDVTILKPAQRINHMYVWGAHNTVLSKSKANVYMSDITIWGGILSYFELQGVYRESLGQKYECSELWSQVALDIWQEKNTIELRMSTQDSKRAVYQNISSKGCCVHVLWKVWGRWSLRLCVAGFIQMIYITKRWRNMIWAQMKCSEKMSLGVQTESRKKKKRKECHCFLKTVNWRYIKWRQY